MGKTIIKDSFFSNMVMKDTRFTEVEMNVLDYIKEHLDETIHMNISELAKKAFTSNGTIIRVCRKLGCDGFKELKYRLLKESEAQKYVVHSVDFSYPFNINSTAQDVVNNIASLYKESINVILSSIDISLLKKASQQLIQAKRIFVFAVGDSLATSEIFINKLSKIGCFPILASQKGQSIMFTQHITKDDCALFVSYSGESAVCLKCSSLLRKKQIPIIALTACPNSTLGINAQTQLIIPYMEGLCDLKLATFYSHVAFEYILDNLYALMSINNDKKNALK